MTTIGALTKKIRIGTGVTAPIYRYHPAIIAQAFGTLGELFPGRIYLGLGTGEAMNEVPLGFNWPNFKVRVEMFKESVDIIKLLWKSTFVNYSGSYYKLKDANLYLKPGRIPIYIAASGKTIAKFAGGEADGFMTSGFKPNNITIPIIRSLLEAVKEGADNTGRNFYDIPKMGEFVFSYNEDHDKALKSISKLRAAMLPNAINDFVDPREMDRLAENVNPNEIEKYWLVTTDIEECIRCAEDLIRLGFNEIQFHSSSPDEDEIINKFSEKVLPYLKDSYS
jgi:coenzyme F420-dependent glucose-6-phosphate dehydrogenase